MSLINENLTYCDNDNIQLKSNIMRNIIDENEVKRILTMHKSLKEQNTPPKPEMPTISEPQKVETPPTEDPLLSKLREAVKAGCLGNGKLYLNKTKNMYYFRSLKQSTKQEIDFFPDMTYNFVDGTKKGKWFCSLAQKAAKEAATTDSTNNLTQMKDRGWMEYGELTGKGFSTLEAKEGKYETTQFDMGNGNKITLYKPKNIGGELKQYTKVQQDLLNKYTKSGYKLKSQIGLDEIGSWEQFTLNFPDGSGSVVLYKDPSFVTNVTAGSEPSMEKQDALISGDKRAKVCREKIKDFADSANKKLKLPMSQINADKTFVMACRDQFGMKYNDLGVTKKNLEYLTGQRDGLDGYKLKVGSPYRL
jgi:hypothetical protein